MADLFFSSQPQTRIAAPHLQLASDVPDDCDVYVFYIPGMTSYDDLKKALTDYGKAAGKNIFVGLWELSAKPYKEILTYFKIKKSPAVIVSGPPKWSTDGQAPTQTAFARIDNPKVLNDLKTATDCISQTCNLFMQGKVKQALSSARKDQFKASLEYYLKKLGSGVIQVLQKFSISFDIAKGTITISPASGSGTSPSTGSKK